MRGTTQSVSGLWANFSPKQSMRYSFLDERFAMMYADVQQMGRIFTSFAVLAIVVACLGLFALSAFMTEQRSKEISIRLALGASLNSIFQMLTRSFLLLVMISLVIASPIAWFMMQRWLEGFVYRVGIGWDVFVLSGVLAAMIALLTISYQSIRAALMNPVKNLRSE